MTQNAKIVKFLKTGKKLSEAQALKMFGVQNLRARVHEIRTKLGMQVITTHTKKGNLAYHM